MNIKRKKKGRKKERGKIHVEEVICRKEIISGGKKEKKLDEEERLWNEYLKRKHSQKRVLESLKRERECINEMVLVVIEKVKRNLQKRRNEKKKKRIKKMKKNEKGLEGSIRKR